MRKIALFLLAAVILTAFACDDKTKTGETETGSTMNIADTAAQKDTMSAAAVKVPYKVVPNADAQSWYKAYQDLITASTTGSTPPAFDATKIVTQITLFDDVSRELRKLSPKKVKFCVALKPGNIPTVLIQVKLQNDTFMYYDMDEPTNTRTAKDEYDFCPPPPGCALEEAP